MTYLPGGWFCKCGARNAFLLGNCRICRRARPEPEFQRKDLWQCSCGAVGIINLRADCRVCGKTRKMQMQMFRVYANEVVRAVFVKSEQFFQQQRKEDAVWGNGHALISWHPILAESLEDARARAAECLKQGIWPPPRPETASADAVIPETVKTAQEAAVEAGADEHVLEAAEQTVGVMARMDAKDVVVAQNFLANVLMTLWAKERGQQVPWKTAVEITAIVTGLSESQKNALLAL